MSNETLSHCGRCCAAEGVCDLAFKGVAGVCCGSIDALPFCCPSAGAECYRARDEEYRCRILRERDPGAYELSMVLLAAIAGSVTVYALCIMFSSLAAPPRRRDPPRRAVYPYGIAPRRDSYGDGMVAGYVLYSATHTDCSADYSFGGSDSCGGDFACDN